jgi:uncharacterized protein
MSDTRQFDRNKPSETAGSAANPVRGLQEIGRTGRGKISPENWNPPFCGDIDMRIASDGTWYYLNSPIGRKPLVQLFASVMRREEDLRYYLVTPVEKCGIRVDDAPFVAVAMAVSGQGGDQEIALTTNLDDTVTVDDRHPLRFADEVGTAGLKPYVLVRGRLEALVARPIFYDLVALGTVERRQDTDWFGVWSGGRFWPMARARDIGIGPADAGT